MEETNLQQTNAQNIRHENTQEDKKRESESLGFATGSDGQEALVETTSSQA